MRVVSCERRVLDRNFVITGFTLPFSAVPGCSVIVTSAGPICVCMEPFHVPATSAVFNVKTAMIARAWARSRLILPPIEGVPQYLWHLAHGLGSAGSRKLEFVRDAIWDAAVDLFAEKAFDETTVDDIVVAAGTSRRTFFRHFESKRDLVAQPVVSHGASLTEVIASCPTGLSPGELFRHVVLAVA
jgi:Bacterial regulatory proteins, tetR family